MRPAGRDDSPACIRSFEKGHINRGVIHMSQPQPTGPDRPKIKRRNAAHPRGDRPIPDVYPVIDNDLARDNLENDIPAADLQDL